MKTLNEVNEIKNELRGKTLGYISGALGFVAGLAWNEAITTMIDNLFPLSKDTVTVKFIYAALVTVLVVILVRYLERITNRPAN